MVKVIKTQLLIFIINIAPYLWIFKCFSFHLLLQIAQIDQALDARDALTANMHFNTLKVRVK